ncbi:MAG: hypothetical protein ACYSTT_19690 [Planctomycetota bacterium]|jgi:hypothetical protein
MVQEIDLKNIEQKTFSQSQQDGLMELVMGICMLAISTRLFSRFLIFMLALPVFLFGPLLALTRRRFTHPRIGYVKLLPDKPKSVIAGILLVTLVVIAAMAVAFFFFGDVRDFNLWMRWCPFWGGTVLAGMFSSLASKSGAVRYYIFAVWSFLSGIALSMIKFDIVETGVLLYFAVMGGLLIPFGLIQFAMFLRKHPKVAQEA